MAFTLITDFTSNSQLPPLGVSIKKYRANDSGTTMITAQQQIDLASAIGAKFVRIDLLWADCELTTGTYTWPTYYDDLKTKAIAAGMKCLFILGQGNSLYTAGWNVPPQTSTSRTAFANWCTAVRGHFGGSYVWYEIYNEPNLNWPGYWSDATLAAQEWGLMVTAGATALKAAGACVVFSGGLSVFNPETFATAAFPYVDKTKLDGVGYHPYTGADLYGVKPETNTWDKFTAIRTAYSGGPPVANTEQGFELNKCSGTTTTDKLKRQGTWAARFVLSNLLKSQPLAIWYDLIDDGTDANDPEKMLGLYDYNMVIKSSGTSFRQMADLRNTCVSAKTYKDTDTYQIVFTMSDGSKKTVTWMATGTGSVTIPLDEIKYPVISY